MAVGKAINRGAAMRGEIGGNVPEIEMPPLDQQAPIAEQPDPWSSERKMASQLQQHENPFSVPDQVPQDVVQAMSSHQDFDQEPVSTEDVEQRVESVKPTPQDSFKSLREAKERAERERDAFLAQMLEMQQRSHKQVVQEPEQQVYEEEDIDFNLDEDALVEGKYVKKVVNEIKNLKSQLKNYQNKSNETAMEAKIKANYPDFERVVSKENVERLNAQFPEIAQSLRDTQDIYSKAASAYTVIKKFGIYQDAQQAPYENERAKAVINSNKPRPLASVSPQQGDSPLSKANAFANGMTKDLQKQLLAEMYASRKNM